MVIQPNLHGNRRQSHFTPGKGEQVIASIDENKQKTRLQFIFWPPAFLLTSIGFILSFIALKPGLMSYDSFYMYHQGVNSQFTDWHHPFLPILMLFSRIISGDTSLLLLFQSACLWIGVYLFAVSIRYQIGSWALLSILIGYTPIILNQIGYLGKTSVQTAMFLVVFGICYYHYSTRQRPSLPTRLFLLFPLFLGTTIRSYSYISAIPIIMFFTYIAIINDGIKHIVTKCIFITLVILIIFAITEKTIIYKVLKVERTYKSATLFEYDLAGIMAISSKLYGTRFLLPEFKNQEAILRYYTKYKGSWRIIGIFGKDKNREGRVYQNIFNKEDHNFLFQEWITAIIENPLSYLKHRCQAISYTLGLSNNIKGPPYEKSFRNKINKHGLQKSDNSIWRIFKKYNNQFQQTILFKPWFWFVLNFIIFTLSLLLIFRKRFTKIILPHAVLNSSGTLFCIVYLFIGLSNSARFIYWGMVSTALSTFGIVLSIINSGFRHIWLRSDG